MKKFVLSAAVLAGMAVSFTAPVKAAQCTTTCYVIGNQQVCNTSCY